MDYGKLAYLKAEDLDKRLSLFNSTASMGNRRIFFSINNSITLTKTNNLIEEFFILKRKSNLELQFSGVITSTTSQSIVVELLLNNAVFYRHTMTVGSSPSSYNLGKMLNNIANGNNSLVIRFVINGNVTLQSSLISVSGDSIVQYNKYTDIAYCDTNETIGLLTNDGNIEIHYSVINSNPLILNTAVLRIKEFKLIYFGQYLYIIYTNDKGKLSIGISSNLGGNDLSVNNNVTSFDIVKLSNTTALILFVVLGRAYFCNIDISSGNISEIKPITGLSATDRVTKVNANSSGLNVVAILECKGKTQLLVDRGTGLTIERSISVSDVSAVKISGNIVDIYSSVNKLVSVSQITMGLNILPLVSPIRYCDKLIPSSKSKMLILDLGKVTLE